MKTTSYAGIDYGLGRSNINHASGIRFGVISQHSISGEAFEWRMTPDYGSPHCPKCGSEVSEKRDDFDYECECGPAVCADCNKVFYPMEVGEDGECPNCLGETAEKHFEVAPHASGEYVCHSCAYLFDGEDAFPDEVQSWNCDEDGYLISRCLDSDLVVTASPYVTYAQFCSPCVPGACNLDSPLEEPVANNRCYCLGHDWFEGGKAPYPVFSVATGEQVQPT